MFMLISMLPLQFPPPPSSFKTKKYLSAQKQKGRNLRDLEGSQASSWEHRNKPNRMKICRNLRLATYRVKKSPCYMCGFYIRLWVCPDCGCWRTSEGHRLSLSRKSEVQGTEVKYSNHWEVHLLYFAPKHRLLWFFFSQVQEQAT